MQRKNEWWLISGFAHIPKPFSIGGGSIGEREVETLCGLFVVSSEIRLETGTSADFEPSSPKCAVCEKMAETTIR